jgi:phosphoribosyl 1,2-cyclic phosphodiesterase
MKVCLLTSGSIGNTIFIEHEEESILIDCGVSFKKFDELVSQTDLNMGRVKSILVTHEHSDHIKGVGVTSRRLGLQVWATKKTADAIYEKGILKESDPRINFVEKYKEYEISGFKITPFPLSHDAKDPVGYLIERDGKRVVCLTDTGYVSREVMEVVKDADLYIMEMNHNIEMLHMCARPWSLKQRILGDYGHLSNEDGAYIFSKVMGDKTKHVFLAHISQDANLPDLAMMTIKGVLKDHNIDVSKLNIHMTYPMQPSHTVVI